jgi:hypothetical protein
MAPCLFAHGDEKNCQLVSGGVVTNFLDESGVVNGMSFVTATLGTTTGDLRGGIGVYVFSITGGSNNSPLVIQVHHHWVLDTGDTIFLADAHATAHPTGVPGLYATGEGEYIVQIVGGTGRFAGASGYVSNFGVVDMNQHKAMLRYEGEICFERPEH